MAVITLVSLLIQRQLKGIMYACRPLTYAAPMPSLLGLLVSVLHAVSTLGHNT